MTSGSFNVKAQHEIGDILEPRERLIWTGVPKRGLQLRISDAFLIPFSIFWGGFAIFWEMSAIRSGAPTFIVLFGVPFVLIGLYLIIGRFFWDARARANTVYGLTNLRAIIISGVVTKTTSSVLLQNLTDISIRTRANGEGTIVLGRPNPFYGWWGRPSWPGADGYAPPSFELISDARRVYELILKTQREASGDSAHPSGLR